MMKTILVCGATLMMVAGPAFAQPRPMSARPLRAGLACAKQRDRALVTNNTSHTLPVGTYLEVHATGPTSEAEGTGSMQLTQPLAPGGTYTSVIRFSMNFTACTARVVG